MDNRLTNLRTAVQMAIETHGYTQKELAAKIGITAGMLSRSLAGKEQMREEHWRMACELLGLDYDEIMGYKVPVETIAPAEAEEATAPDEMQQPEETANPVEDQADDGIDQRLVDNMRIVCAYVEGKILEEIKRGGWAPDMDRLCGLLDVVCDLRDAVENRE